MYVLRNMVHDSVTVFPEQQMAEKSFFDSVPQDIAEQILLRIQCEKSILRCTSVCKSWLSFIKSSKFINTHLSRPENTKYLFFKNYNASCMSTRPMGYSFSIHSDTAPSRKCCTIVFPHNPNQVSIRGCCSGVICYTLYPDRRGDIFLWNPTIRKLKTLPLSRDRARSRTAVGFLFDNDKNDLMVVRIAYTREVSSVDVYSLSSSCWRTISNTCPGASNNSILDSSLGHDKGTLRWLALHEQSWRVVSLDMNNAEVQERLISVCCFPAQRMLFLKGVDADYYDFLGRHDVGCPNYRDWALYNHLWPTGFRNNGDALFYGWGNNEFQYKSELVSYDFGTKRMEVLGFFHLAVILSAHPFVRSLVLLNDGDATMTSAGMGLEEEGVVVERTRKKRVGWFKRLVGMILECKSCFKVDL